MFGCIKNKAIGMALSGLRDKFVNPNLVGLGRVHNLEWRDKELHVTLTLDGLDAHPIEVVCSGIEISPEADSVRITEFDATMPFAKNALNRFARDPFPIPEGAARTAVKAAKACLGL